MSNEPHVRNLALANAAPRCRARTRADTACTQPAMANSRCRLHGGKSTGPRTPEGLERSRKARWKHGYYSVAASSERREAREAISMLQELVRVLTCRT